MDGDATGRTGSGRVDRDGPGPNRARADAGWEGPGPADAGRADLGHADLGRADLGREDAGWEGPGGAARGAAWLDGYFRRYTADAFDRRHYPALLAFRALCARLRASGGKLLLAGNGASASLAAHAAADLTRQAGLRALCFHEPGLITGLVNDHGAEHWVRHALSRYADPGDAVALISVSGASPNLLRAAEWCRGAGLPVVALTGMAADNPLRALADVALHMPSAAYNVVEGVHGIWLMAVVDMLVGRAEYAVR